MDRIIRSAVCSSDIAKRHSHYHDCHQIIFIKNGEIEIEINRDVKRAKSGDIIIISRFENHSIKVLSNVYERYVLRISTDLSDMGRAYSVLTNRPESFKNVVSCGDRFSEMCFIFDKICTEAQSEDDFSAQMDALLLEQLLISICRLEPQDAGTVKAEGFNTVSDIQRRFEQNCGEQFSLSSLAKEYHTSVSSLSHNFKKITGLSVYEYLMLCRIALSKRYLSKTDLSIGEIVDNCGFTDASNFSRTFKKMIGISPSDFRKKYK